MCAAPLRNFITERLFVEIKGGLLVIGLQTAETSEQIVELTCDEFCIFVKKLSPQILALTKPGKKAKVKVQIKEHFDSYFFLRKIVINDEEEPLKSEVPVFLKCLADSAPYILLAGRSTNLPFVSFLQLFSLFLSSKVPDVERQLFFSHLSTGYFNEQTCNSFLASRPKIPDEKETFIKNSLRVFLQFHHRLLQSCTTLRILVTDEDELNLVENQNKVIGNDGELTQEI